MLKGLGNFASLVKSAQQIQGRMAEMQEKLAQVRVKGSAGGEMVTVEANGQQRILGVHIERSLWESRDLEMVEDLLIAATNQALDKAREAGAKEMSNLTSGLELSGLSDALSKMGIGDRPGSEH